MINLVDRVVANVTARQEVSESLPGSGIFGLSNILKDYPQKLDSVSGYSDYKIKAVLDYNVISYNI